MVNDLSQVLLSSSVADQNPRLNARERLLSLKQRHGTYQWVTPEPARDIFKLGESKPQAPDHKQLILKQSTRIGVVGAASILGGIIGGGVLGAVLAAAGAAGLISLLEKKEFKAKALLAMLAVIPAGMMARFAKKERAEEKLPEFTTRFSPRVKGFEGIATNAVEASPPEKVKELAKDRLKRVIVSAAIQNAAEQEPIIRSAPSQKIYFGSLRNSAIRFRGTELASRCLPAPPDDVVRHVPVHNMDAPVGIIDLGSSGAKLVIVHPKERYPIEKRVNVNMGKSLGKNGNRLDAATISDVESALLEFKQLLAENNVDPENTRVVATAGLRDAVDAQGGKIADRLSELLGQQIEIIDPVRESALVYRSVLRNQDRMSPHQQNLVIEVGGGSTEFAFGKGQRAVDENLSEKGYVKVGSKKLNVEDPFSPIDVALAREKAKKQMAGLDPSVEQAAKDRPAYLSRNDVYKVLAEIERKRSNVDILQDGLNRETIDWYLSPDGLEHLKKIDLAGEYQSYGSGTVRSIVEKLCILREAAGALNINQYHFGAGGGMKAGLLDEVVREQITRRSELYGRQLHDRYQAEYPVAREQLRKLLPEFADQVDGRCKDPSSIADKIRRKAVRSSGELSVIRNLWQANRVIGDGHGLALVLNEVSRANIEKVRDELIRGIKSGDVQVLEINNFRGEGENAMPYFTDDDIERVRMAMEMKRMRTPHAERPPILQVVDGPGAIKPSGYTSTQLNIRLRNPQTGEYDFPVCEFHIRGKELNEFYAVEHLAYDIRQGKNIYKNPEVKARFEPEVKPLLDAIEQMPEEDYKQFTSYLSQYYLYCRKLESGHVPPEPQLPANLPAICHVDELKRLSKLQKELIGKSHD